MLRENLKDAGEIIQNILTQPLAVSDDEMISLLNAAQNYTQKDARTSELRQLILNFLQFKEPTDMLLRELELILEDIKQA